MDGTASSHLHLDTPVVSPSSQQRILIVADQPEVVESLFRVLTAVGYAVEAIAADLSCVERVQSKTPNLILLDADLLELEACSLCQAIKANPHTQPIPIVFILGDASELNRTQVFEVGGADYIVQPLVLPELLSRVAHQLSFQLLPPAVPPQRVERLLKTSSLHPLLSSLQKQLHQQAAMLQNKNLLLQQEIRERQRIQDALKIQQDKTEQLLLSILPRAIVDKLQHDGGTIAEQFDDVTILFADIVDFTPLSSRTSPLQLVSLLNNIFSTFDGLAEKFGLEKIKTIGDAYMAACGVPIPRPDHTEAVLEMAIAMRQEVSQFTLDNGKPIRLRIGINTGTVVAGVIGTSKFTYDLWGDAVNIASRMESQGLPSKIQVTEACYQRLRDKYNFEQWSNLNVKGRGQMTTYLFVNRRE